MTTSDLPESQSLPSRRDALAQLAIESEVRDKNQVDVRFRYALRGKQSAFRYTVDTFLFIPRNVGVSRANYSKESFYSDVTALMRLDATPLPLDKLADPTCRESPAHLLARTLTEFQSSQRVPDSRPLIAHVKLYAYLFTAAVRARLKHVGRSLSKSKAAPDDKRAQVDRELESALAETRAALAFYRSMRGAFWPFERICHESMPEAMRAADEYMSLFLEERLARLARRLDGQPPSELVARLRLRATMLAREETAYRRKYGYLVLVGDDAASGEYFAFRSSILKKSVQQALYLDAREVTADMFLRNAVGMLGAMLAAIWALAAQIPLTVANASGNLKLLVFVVPVFAYVMKDRIKALTNEHLVKRVRRFDHTSWLSGTSLREVGLGMLDARVQEVMKFTNVKDVADDVRRSRLEHRTLPHADFLKEEVIHYRKVIEVGTREAEGGLADTFWVRDILRFNVRSFLGRLDEPLDTAAFFDERRSGFRTTSIPKVYHLNFVIRLRRESADGRQHERLERLRLVLDKTGIVRIEARPTAGPTELPPAKRALRLPFGISGRRG